MRSTSRADGSEGPPSPCFLWCGQRAFIALDLACKKRDVSVVVIFMPHRMSASKFEQFGRASCKGAHTTVKPPVGE
ncbi:hypothetical protein PCAR4_530033 [Paraburkholderia caribensis]|nr:hypothetical protein PCAR4_530033 [Paraburkholderia caribensis]